MYRKKRPSSFKEGVSSHQRRRFFMMKRAFPCIEESLSSLSLNYFL
ncbi:hypothetical protein HMPREF0973_00171 [Prevotella veroralis F0319]|uniref:Uncharacterized protein n=1 Tax=Prevotella veroralis F0319 TaxID=649761 RepID=C9MKP7_9BACT|nr:hypothetical protein HMPREF0973_00171 [Prevotella veroralis F0319]